jgi:hypothetical protein
MNKRGLLLSSLVILIAGIVIVINPFKKKYVPPPIKQEESDAPSDSVITSVAEVDAAEAAKEAEAVEDAEAEAVEEAAAVQNSCNGSAVRDVCYISVMSLGLPENIDRIELDDVPTTYDKNTFIDVNLLSKIILEDGQELVLSVDNRNALLSNCSIALENYTYTININDCF